MIQHTLPLAYSTSSGGATEGVDFPAAAGTLTLVDDDAGPGTCASFPRSVSRSEKSATAVFTVQRVGGSEGTVSVSYATSVSGTVVFGAGETTKTSTVPPVIADALAESPETITLTLGTPGGGATLGSPQAATLYIVDDDP